jgi:phage/plasmid primase-like uncharacterized protein
MRDSAGALRNLQTIGRDGSKLYTKGAAKQGMHALLGQPEPGKPIVIAEGFATAASILEATGLPVAVAFDSGNLRPVAEQYRALDPARPIIIAADNDHHLPRRDPPLPNAGLKAAQATAQAVNGIVVAPEIPSHHTDTDWNDIAQRKGLAAVRAEFALALQQHGIALPEQPVKSTATDARAKDRAAWDGVARAASRQTEAPTAQQSDQPAATP